MPSSVSTLTHFQEHQPRSSGKKSGKKRIFKQLAVGWHPVLSMPK